MQLLCDTVLLVCWCEINSVSLCCDIQTIGYILELYSFIISYLVVLLAELLQRVYRSTWDGLRFQSSVLIQSNSVYRILLIRREGILPFWFSFLLCGLLHHWYFCCQQCIIKCHTFLYCTFYVSLYIASEKRSFYYFHFEGLLLICSILLTYYPLSICFLVFYLD